MRLRHAALAVFLWFLAAGTGADGLWATVGDAVDGDTLRLEDGRLVRYLGIDAPEINHKTGFADPFGYAALDANRRLVKGRRVRLVPGRRVRDRYGRLLAFVFDPDGRMINKLLVEQGLAIYYPFSSEAESPMYRELLAAQRDAMSRGAGRWADKATYSSGPFFGNRNSKRFHAPDCPAVGQTRKRNRIRFKTRWEAHWAGFLPGGGCLASPIKKELRRR